MWEIKSEAKEICRTGVGNPLILVCISGTFLKIQWPENRILWCQGRRFSLFLIFSRFHGDFFVNHLVYFSLQFIIKTFCFVFRKLDLFGAYVFIKCFFNTTMNWDFHIVEATEFYIVDLMNILLNLKGFGIPFAWPHKKKKKCCAVKL